jgi:uncharacterized membrane protein YqgA involved in biofilm formation
MLGTLVNAAVIVVCALLGCFLVRGIPPRFEDMLKRGIGIAIVYIGLRGAFDNKRPLLLIMSCVAGALIGEAIDIDKWMNRAGRWMEARLGMAENSGGGRKRSFAKGFAAATILFCTGSMAIVGAMQSGLTGNHQTLYAKSILDGSVSLVFGASMGIGVAFAAIPVLLYQGGIALLSMAVRDALPAPVITEMSAVGNLLVAAIGFNFLCFPGDGLADDARAIKVANLIPAIFIPLVFMSIEKAVS